MPAVRLNQRIYGPHGSDGLSVLRSLLQNMLHGIEVEVSEVTVGPGSWAEVFLDGSDIDVAVGVLAECIGVLPRVKDELSRGVLLKGRISSLKDDGLYVDVGLKDFVVKVPIRVLRSQLIDACSTKLEEARRIYMLYGEFPVEIYIEEVHRGAVEARLSWRWLRWVEGMSFSGLSLVYVAGLTLRRVRRALRKTKYEQAILGYRKLGALESLILLDPLVEVEGFSRWLEKVLNPLTLEFSKPFKGGGEITYAVQDEVWLTTSPPFQIP